MVASKLAVTAGLVGAFAANAPTPAAQAPDLVLRGGAVFTADVANPTATAVAAPNS
jgi:hypothetical protein